MNIAMKFKKWKWDRSLRAIDIGIEFRKLKWEWEDETSFNSSFTDRVLHPSYQKIIGLGPSVIPHILEDLKRGPEHWDWALRAITRQDPIPPEIWGDLEAIRNRWLAWGHERGLVFYL